MVNRDEAVLWGYNSRLDELQAAFASIKLKNIEFLTKRYIEIAESYNKKLQTIKDCNHKINEIYLFCMKNKMDDPENKEILRKRVTETFKAIK